MIGRRRFSTALGLGAGVTASLTALGGNAAAAAPPAASGTAGTATGVVGADGASAAAVPDPAAGVHTSFPEIKQVRAGVLTIGYAELGPAHGPVVICLHGWPYDIHSYVDVAPMLAERGFRVIVPYLRGHGTTRFLSEHTFRNAQQSVVALDIIALMDALHIDKALMAGFDWGSRTADIIAALWPERCTALVSVSGYLVTNVAANAQPAKAEVEYAWWYQYYFATERGKLAMEDEGKRRDLARLIWTVVSPTWAFDDATFARTATAFANPDYAAIVLHNYRWRLGLAAGDPHFDRLEARLAARPTIGVPTITVDSDRDPFTTATDGGSYRGQFTGPYGHRVLTGVGHNVPQEAPTAFAQAVVDAHRL
jgi:pimeloyl-ACP methyl ester carboxylesterase